MIEERLIILDDLKYFLGLPVDHDNVNGTVPMHIKGHERNDSNFYFRKSYSIYGQIFTS